ncbi:hypothetical protein ACFFQG_31195, partial [Shinella granuli]
GRILLRPQQHYAAATVADFCTAALTFIAICALIRAGASTNTFAVGFRRDDGSTNISNSSWR